MVLEAPLTDSIHSPAWPWRVGLVVESAALASELTQALESLNAPCVFRAQPGAAAFEIARIVERHKPDLLFVELACVTGAPQQWLETIRCGGDTLIAAVHTSADPNEMITALRAGACEFIHLPIRPGIFETMDRFATILESRRTRAVERGTLTGMLSAKGGCGATTLVCHLAIATRHAAPTNRVLVADLDHQAAAAHRLFRKSPLRHTTEAFESARRLNSASWPEFVCHIEDGVDLLAGARAATDISPDAWRIDSLFRFVTRQYTHVLVDLGRNLNPFNFAFLQSLDELIIVTAPDVLALFQTRQILQTLSSRGFDKNRVRLILNRNHVAPQDFWVESIEQMFEIRVLEVIPNDYGTLNGMPRDRFEFPASTNFGRTLNRLAGKLAVAHSKKVPESGRYRS
ncbi:MAG TPA: AAA family ATPase [Bryobacteraceae bacterium]|nr:AAA family ATPase [Bryobacteraceae bacterium]